VNGRRAPRTSPDDVNKIKLRRRDGRWNGFADKGIEATNPYQASLSRIYPCDLHLKSAACLY
jgi:hypothetical protein